ncbi:uncharacterized protein YALI1_D24130g [Yarrowia lipolytica]|uniref:Uncharacterized protein n=1 Tax=Yarrowia lipolytica TaxID=4952 RepID=A0A1D8NFA2_YARLL|nr:hypothetical protein YALI1_D24130g [Yarrowia lipolytica]
MGMSERCQDKRLIGVCRVGLELSRLDRFGVDKHSLRYEMEMQTNPKPELAVQAQYSTKESCKNKYSLVQVPPPKHVEVLI